MYKFVEPLPNNYFIESDYPKVQLYTLDGKFYVRNLDTHKLREFSTLEEAINFMTKIVGYSIPDRVLKKWLIYEDLEYSNKRGNLMKKVTKVSKIQQALTALTVALSSRIDKLIEKVESGKKIKLPDLQETIYKQGDKYYIYSAFTDDTEVLDTIEELEQYLDSALY
jgi:hypothetical protein